MKNNSIKVLFIGDIVGRPGRRAVENFLAENKNKYDLVVANGENLAGGRGMTKDTYDQMVQAGVDYFTSGNHIWNNRDFIPLLDQKDIKVLRPANYPKITPGKGYAQLELKGNKILIINLQGRVFMPENLDNPFLVAEEIIKQNDDKIAIIDIHAEATSEKVALGLYLDGRVSAVLGTHTHIQTADEKILPKGTAYISDVGMCGPVDSVLGVEKEIIIQKFLTELPQSHRVASGRSIFNAIELEIDTHTKKTLNLERISKTYS